MAVEQWLRAFDDAAFVLTDSFHGCVFSILFKKSFIAFANQDRGVTRFTSLLSLFSLNERLIFTQSDYEKRKESLQKEIDYIPVYKELKKQRNKAFNFLRVSIKNS